MAPPDIWASECYLGEPQKGQQAPISGAKALSTPVPHLSRVKMNDLKLGLLRASGALTRTFLGVGVLPKGPQS